MPTTFIPADPEFYRLLDGLISDHRHDLDASDPPPKILLLFAFSDNGKPPMRHHGSRVLGTCQVHSYADKVKGAPDATITLDGDWWADATPNRRLALLHHELSHIAPHDGDTDQLDRPRLKSRRGDWEFDGFHELVEIYGSDAAEYRNLAAIAEKHRQLKLPWSLPADDDGERTALKAEINEAFRAAATEVPEGQPAATTGHAHGAMANRTAGRGGETI